MATIQKLLDSDKHLDDNATLRELLAIVYLANDAIMQIYDTHSVVVETKADNTPLTQADIASHQIISAGLSSLFPDVPVISEEGDQELNKKHATSDLFWLVDPIDGTKEYIARTGEFTVCIALIQNGNPVFGIVSAPALGITYYGGLAVGSYKITEMGDPERIHVSAEKTGIVIGSKSSTEPATIAYIKEHYPDSSLQLIGSQLKMALIAEGKADAFPRINGPLHAWDLAAQHAVLEGAGGIVTRPDESIIDYRDPTLMAGDFVGRSF